MTVKRELLNYIQFLQQNGFLYAEEPEPQSVLSRPQASVVTENRARAMAPSTSASAEQTQLFAPAPAPKPKMASAPAMAAAVLSREERIARLAAATARAEQCRACGLGKTRHKLVYADGDPMAPIAFVGEAPGGEEDLQGLPFVGRAGQLLNKMIAAIGFKREEVYICNTLKCRPPENRDPLPKEKDACEHFLVEQLEIVRPKLLVALGSHAAQYLCRSEETIGRLRGRWHNYHGIPLLATYHPAFLLRSPGFKPKAWEDFKTIHAKYSELCPHDPRKLWSKDVS